MQRDHFSHENYECRIRAGIRGHVLRGIGDDELHRRLPRLSEHDREIIYRWYAETYMDRLRADDGGVGRFSSDPSQLVFDWNEIA